MITKKKLAKNLDGLQAIVAQNARTSQSFCEEQLRINKILSDFKNKTDEKLSQLDNNKIAYLEGSVKSLQSQIDKTKNILDKITGLLELAGVMLSDDSKEIKHIKTFIGMLVKTLNLELETTPAVEATTKLVIKKKKK